jgi:hypothetical protein
VPTPGNPVIFDAAGKICLPPSGNPAIFDASGQAACVCEPQQCQIGPGGNTTCNAPCAMTCGNTPAPAVRRIYRTYNGYSFTEHWNQIGCGVVNCCCVVAERKFARTLSYLREVGKGTLTSPPGFWCPAEKQTITIPSTTPPSIGQGQLAIPNGYRQDLWFGFQVAPCPFDHTTFGDPIIPAGNVCAARRILQGQSSLFTPPNPVPPDPFQQFGHHVVGYWYEDCSLCESKYQAVQQQFGGTNYARVTVFDRWTLDPGNISLCAPGNTRGACCCGDTCMSWLTAAECAALNGVFHGVGSACPRPECAESIGACCMSSGGCLLTTLSGCATAGGSWLGVGSTCPAPGVPCSGDNAKDFLARGIGCGGCDDGGLF